MPVLDSELDIVVEEESTVLIGETVNSTVTGVKTARSKAKPLPPGTRVGRYVLLEPIGQGSMGIVYAAWDGELHRRVAIKLLHAGGSHSENAESRKLRLLREAQSLAQLSHPNVVAVHDVGTMGDSVFMAMEFVEGQTLRSWLKEGQTQKDILRVLLDAGAGLAAAHQSGLIHRDFKPDNVLVGDDGRVFVTDFGLARLADAVSESPMQFPSSALESLNADVLHSPLTQVGTLMGTYPYMSPELVAREPADAKTDQFAFTVTVYEALYGKRPFKDSPFKDPERWKLQAPPSGVKVPRWIRKVLTRELTAPALARHESVADLLQTLQHPPGQRRNRVLAIAALCVAVATAAVVGREFLGRHEKLCTGQEAVLRGVWDAPTEQKLQQAFAAVPDVAGADVWARTRAVIDSYAKSLVAARQEACEATRVYGSQSDEVLSLRMACLDRRVTGLRALVDVFATPNAATLNRSVQAASDLAQISGCADTEALRAPARLPEDPATRASVEQLRGKLAQAQALVQAAKFTEAQPVVEAVIAQAAPLQYRPLEAEAQLLLGQVQEQTGKLKEADASLHAAFAAAQAGRHLEMTAASSTGLVRIAYLQTQPENGQQWATIAASAIEGMGGSPAIEAKLKLQLGSLAYQRKDWVGAESLMRDALALRLKVYPPEDPEVARGHYTVGMVLVMQKRLDEATDALQRAVELYQKTLGPDHPDTYGPVQTLGSLYLEGVRPTKEAEGLLAASMDVITRTAGTQSPRAARARGELGRASLFLGKYARAKELLEQSYEVLVATTGPGSPVSLETLWLLSELSRRTGQLDQAVEFGQRMETEAKKSPVGGAEFEGIGMVLQGRALCEQGHGKQALLTLRRAHARFAEAKVEEDYLAIARRGLGACELRLGRLKDALVDLEWAQKVEREMLPAASPALAETLVYLGAARYANGDSLGAEAALAAAVPKLESNNPAPERLSAARFALAKAVAESGDYKRARTLAQAALEDAAKSELDAHRAQSQIKLWLAGE